MRIIRFRHDQGIHFGIVDGDTIDVLAGEPFAKIESSGHQLALPQVKLLAPVQPPNLLAIGLNYRLHAAESSAEVPERPLLFIKANTSVIGPREPIVLPRMAPREVDYEAELCIVIGQAARHVTPEDALEHVLGYTCGNDVSARDCQLKQDGQWARGKSFDTFCPLGPWIETSLDGDNVPLCSRVNGQVMQQSSTSDLIFRCAELVSYLSRCMTLLPGTVIMTGTPSGVGFARRPPVFLKPGDTVEIEIGGIGTLTNPVVAE